MHAKVLSADDCNRRRSAGTTTTDRTSEIFSLNVVSENAAATLSVNIFHNRTTRLARSDIMTSTSATSPEPKELMNLQ
jgi:hypothetical protein